MDVDLEELLGRRIDAVERLLDYGYRAAWKVSAGGGVFLVKADERADWAQHELGAHAHAARNGLPVAQLVADAEGPPRTFAFRWVEGEPLYHQSSPAAWRAAGGVLRRIHDLDPPNLRETWGSVEFFEGELGWMVEHGAISVGEAQTALAAARRMGAVIDGIPRTWIHGDCQPGHFIIEPATGEVRAVIDWADAQRGVVDMDFAVLALSEECQFEAVLDGYGADAALRQRLSETVPLYQAVRAAGAFRWLETHGYPGHTWPAEKIRGLGS